MRVLFYHSSPHWTGSARAFAMAARGLGRLGVPVTVVCQQDTSAERGFIAAEVDVVRMPIGGSVTGDAWRLRKVLKDRFIEVVFLHTEREQLVASSAMRLAERGAVIRRISAGATVKEGRSGIVFGRVTTTRLLFSTEPDRARSHIATAAFVAPLGVDVAPVENARAESRALLNVSDETQLIACVIDTKAGSRITTAMRTLAMLAGRHPDLRLALVGRAADADDVRMHAAALGVTPLVQFLGERYDAPAVLAAADLGWVAAEGDEGAFACLDFMAARVPVVAERSPLVSHYVPDGIAGVLLPPADPSDTASAVARFLGDAAKRSAMGNAGRTRVKRDFGETAMINGFGAAAQAASDRSTWAV
ncbi:MAG: glycosyltransferase [Gemmatimonadota bacterium]